MGDTSYHVVSVMTLMTRDSHTILMTYKSTHPFVATPNVMVDTIAQILLPNRSVLPIRKRFRTTPRTYLTRKQDRRPCLPDWGSRTSGVVDDRSQVALTPHAA